VRNACRRDNACYSYYCHCYCCYDYYCNVFVMHVHRMHSSVKTNGIMCAVWARIRACVILHSYTRLAHPVRRGGENACGWIRMHSNANKIKATTRIRHRYGPVRSSRDEGTESLYYTYLPVYYYYYIYIYAYEQGWFKAAENGFYE
jgi:hypothetical protein